MDHKKAARQAHTALRCTASKLGLARKDLAEIKHYVGQLPDESKSRLALLQQNDLLQSALDRVKQSLNSRTMQVEHFKTLLRAEQAINRKVTAQYEMARKENKFLTRVLYCIFAVSVVDGLVQLAQRYDVAAYLLTLL